MKQEEYKRTHNNSAMAFKNHCDYACAVEYSKAKPWSKWLFWLVVSIALIGAYVLMNAA